MDRCAEEGRRRHIAWALAQPLDVRCRAVLVAYALAQATGGVGSAAPSLDQLQARTRLSEDDVLVALKSLVALQYLQVVEPPTSHQPACYRLGA